MMSIQELSRAAPSPKVYAIESAPNSWVAEATDGCLYVVPKEPGGWIQCEAKKCDLYTGETEELQPLPSHEARSVVWFVYGDVGNIVIAEG